MKELKEHEELLVLLFPWVFKLPPVPTILQFAWVALVYSNDPRHALNNIMFTSHECMDKI